MKKRGRGSEITIKKCSKMLKNTEQQSKDILNSLTEKGYLEKRKDGIINIYKLVMY